MSGQLLSLRLLNNSITTSSFSTMKLSTSFQSSRQISVFSKVFPFRLKYLGFSRNVRFGVQAFSSDSFRSRNGGGGSTVGGRTSKFSNGRGEERKSLVDDEAELSDWIGKIKTDSFRVGLDGERDDDFDMGRGSRGGRGRGRGRGRDSFSSSRDTRGGRGGFSSSFRDKDGSRDMDGYSSSRNQRGGRGGFSSSFGERDRDSYSSSRNQRGGRGSLSSSFRDKDGSRERDSFSSSRNQRGGRGGFSSSKRSRDGDSDDFSISKRSSRGSNLNSRGSMSRRRFSNGSEGETDEELPPRRREYGSRGGITSQGKRVGGNSDMSYGHSRGGENLQKERKVYGRQSLVLSDDEDIDDEESEELTSASESEEETDAELPPRMSGHVSRGGRTNLSNGRGRGGRNFQKVEKIYGGQGALLVSDDEDKDDEEVSDAENGDLMSGFGDLLSDEDNEEGSEEDVIEGASLLHVSAKESVQLTPKISTGASDSYLSQTRFDQCSVSPLSLKGIKDAGYERMTLVQDATLPVILKGKDVLAKAKTGTGKTVAFLLPSIEVIVKSSPVDRDQRRPPINVLVICPTRELASQAAAEANTLLKYHPSIGVQVVIGGVRLALEQKRMQANPCQILVATPGRLKDHIENTAGFATRLMGVKVLVLDEADHLLDMGFRKDIEKIIAAVPKQRQTLLFSATVPEEVRQICHIALKKDHEFINTVEEGSEETHSQVRQMHLVAPLDKHFSFLYVLLKEHISDDVDYKVLVFCTTAMVTRLVANLLSELKMNVREIHSRKPQSYRTRVSDEFRKSKGLILVTSDVSARGVDYPDVTLVIQVGVPADREQYIHRLGRTGRKGKEGEGILLLAPWEEFFLSSVRNLPIAKASAPSVNPDASKKVEQALSRVELKNKEAAYQAWLGYYNSNKTIGRDKSRLVELANEFSRTMGLDNPPAIPKLILGKMGLRNVPGLRSK